MTLRSILSGLLGVGDRATPATLAKVHRHDSQPKAIYAVGDVHGRVDLLKALEDVIVRDAADRSEPCWIVLLGDMIDRGPNSAQVLDHLLSDPPAGFSRLAIAGNHEAMMLDFVDDPHSKAGWLKYGGLETLYSYGITEDKLSSTIRNRRKLRTIVESYIPDEHLALLRDMPDAISFPKALLVHRKEDVGRVSATGPDGSHQNKFNINPVDDGKKWLVHGHTIVEHPCKTDERTICVDTGAYYTDCLSAVRITEDGSIEFLQSPTL